MEAIIYSIDIIISNINYIYIIMDNRGNLNNSTINNSNLNNATDDEPLKSSGRGGDAF